MDIKLLFQQALLHYQQQDYTQAHACLITLTTKAAHFAAAWHVKALTERKLGLLKESELSFKLAIKLAPAEAEIYSNYANLLKAIGRYSESEALFKQAISLNPDFNDAKYNYALLSMEGKKWPVAEQLLHSVLAVMPQHLHATLALVRCYQALGKLDNAMVIVNKALTFNAAEPRLLRLQAELYRQQGNYATAYQCLVPMQSDSLVLREMALCEFLSGNASAAIKLLEQALLQTPFELMLHQTLADIRWQSNDPSWLSSYEKIMESTPEHSTLLLDYVAKLIKAEELSAAEKAVDNALIKTTSAELLLYKGYLRREAGDHDSALNYLQQANKLVANNSQIDNEMLITLLIKSRFQDALIIAQRLTQREPLNQAWWAMLAASFKLAGESDSYQKLYQFDRLIYTAALEAPEHFSSIEVFNQLLLNEIELMHSSKKHPLMQSLRYGTQTEDNLFVKDIAIIQDLKQQITKSVQHYIAQLDTNDRHPFLSRKTKQFLYTGAWSVRLNRSGYHRNHYHSEGWISGCYYVSIPRAVNRNGSGWIKFGQPELGTGLAAEPDYYIKPEAGLLVLFPSMMWHGTEPFQDEDYRVTVAFDLVPLH
jgi:Tfp pilus assembly protein PilF